MVLAEDERDTSVSDATILDPEIPLNSATLPKPSARTTTLLIGVLCMIWGSTWLVIKEGLRDLPPLTSAGLRFFTAFLVLVLVAPILRTREGGMAPPRWLWISSGLTNFAISYGIVYVSETVLPSSLVSVLWAVFPLLVAVAAHHFLPGEKMSVRQGIGMSLGFFGIVLLFATDLTDLGPEAAPMALFLLLSPTVSVIGTIIVKRYGTHTSSVLLNRNGMGIGAAALLTAAAVFERNVSIRWTPAAIGSIAYLAIAGTAVTFSLYFWLLRFAPANRIALIAFVTPCIALVLGTAVAEEPVTRFTVAGTSLVVAGVALVVVRRR